jgi:serine protease
MNFGDILLLEAQTSLNGFSLIPVEVEQAAFDAIRLSTALGIVVVEAAGNGGVNLDNYNDPVNGFVINRTSPNFRDSGAIIVGAASSALPHTRLGFSCFGSRIDCYGWGESINTTGDGWTGNLTNTYTTTFGGTSGASPIVSGAAILFQGIAQASLGFRFSPRQIRAILSNPANGTASGNPAVDMIGVMPNLQALIDNVLNISPDVYLRDYAGDTGNPHTFGAISTSPDIIVKNNPVANPQMAYGQGSGTENNNALSDAVVEKGQPNFVYVRVRNKGGVNAANVTASVYWSPPATLITPNLWHPIGSVNIPAVPNGNILTVSDAITWPDIDIPVPGHYCFVALLDTPNDPAPLLTNLMDWDNFIKFIRNNNNVAWRNFNVDNIIPPRAAEPPGFIRLPFLLTGAPDKARSFKIEINAQLPEKSRLFFEVSRQLAKAFTDNIPDTRFEKLKKSAIIPVKANGAHDFKRTRFPARMKTRCSLLVEIPKEYRQQEYELSIRQLFEEIEVGRITWKLTPDKKDK